MNCPKLVLMIALLFTVPTAHADPASVYDRQFDFKTDRSKDFKKLASSAKYCFVNSNVKVVDTSSPVNPKFLDKLKSFGVEVVARYYGYTNDERPPDNSTVSVWQSAKVITSDEVAMLKARKMYSIAVFQYQSSKESTFQRWKIRGPADGARAVKMAIQLGQPKSSVIFFGADGDFVNGLNRKCVRLGEIVGNCTGEVKSYFTEVKKETKKAGYRLGVYGSGSTCKLLTDAGLVDVCWLNFSTGHDGRNWGFSSPKTVLRQLGEAGVGIPSRKRTEIAKCGRPLDFNEIWNKDFGQFSY